MEHVFEALRDQGRYDSSGRFSLDLAGAKTTLAEFQLSNPGHYVLRLVAAAVAGGATDLALKSVGGGVRLTWDGAGFSRLELNQLFSALLTSDPERQALRELACGLNAARLIFPTIELWTRDVVLKLRGDRMRVQQAPDLPGVTIALTGRRGPLLGVTRSPESRLVRKHCSLAPLRSLARRPRLQGFLVQLGTPPFDWGEPDLERDGCAWGSGLIAISGEGPTVVDVIHSGVTHRLDWRPDFPGAHVYWWTTNLPLDLSRERLVQGGELAEWQHYLLGSLEVAAGRLLAQKPPGQELMAYALGARLPELEQLSLFRSADGVPSAWPTCADATRGRATWPGRASRGRANAPAGARTRSCSSIRRSSGRSNRCCLTRSRSPIWPGRARAGGCLPTSPTWCACPRRWLPARWACGPRHPMGTSVAGRGTAGS